MWHCCMRSTIWRVEKRPCGREVCNVGYLLGNLNGGKQKEFFRV